PLGIPSPRYFMLVRLLDAGVKRKVGALALLANNPDTAPATVIDPDRVSASARRPLCRRHGKVSGWASRVRRPARMQCRLVLRRAAPSSAAGCFTLSVFTRLHLLICPPRKSYRPFEDTHETVPYCPVCSA